MKIAGFRGKRAVIATAATVVALGAGGLTWATAAQADDAVTGSERDRVGAAAVQAVGGGTVVDVETSDDPGQAYEAEVRKDDGTEVEVALDKELRVLAQEAEAAGDRATDGDSAAERQVTAAERASAEAAARTAVPGGTVTDVEAGDDGGAAYEVEVRAADTTEWDVELDAAFKVLAKTADK